MSQDRDPTAKPDDLESGVLEFDALTHAALEGQLSDDEWLAWRERLNDRNFAAAIGSLERAVQVLRNAPPIHAPPGFAPALASEIGLAARLASVQQTTPDGFARAVASGIHVSSRLEAARLRAPEGLASQLARDIALDRQLETIPVQRVPDGFAANLASAISLEAELRQPISPMLEPVLKTSSLDAAERELRALARARVPAGFSARLASEISAEARAQAVISTQPEERNLTPFYFLAGTLGSAALALTALAWPYAQVAGGTALEIARTLPTGLIVTIAGLLSLAGVAASGRVRASLPTSLSAFAVCAALALPQIAPSFGPARVAANQTTGTVLRVGGDLGVAGHVMGDAISLGGNVRLEPGARVDGRIVTLLGDVNLPSRPAVMHGVSAVLGSTHVEGVTDARAPNLLPNLSAASALKPLRALVSASYWQWFYLGIVCALVAVVGLLPGWFEALEVPFWRESGRSIGAGSLALALCLPFGSLAALTLIGAPLGLGLLSLTAVAFTLGLSVSAVQLGRVLRGLFRLPRNAMLEACLGLGVFALTLVWTPLGLAVWVLGGAWGSGALLLAWRAGRLAFVSQQLREEFAG